MKKVAIYTSLLTLAFAATANITFAKSSNSTCQTIQDGTLLDAKLNPIKLGYDKYGYNYQAHMFNGWYDNYSRPDVPVSSGDKLMMKWNDAWLSNKSCDADQKLDRQNGFPDYIGSGAWLTNHASGSYEGNWNVIGTWKWLVLGVYEHDLVITSQNPDGTFTATGGYPAGNYPYASVGQTSETITNGKVEGDMITFKTTYGGPYNAGYSVTVTGTINSDGTITGNGPWEWHSTSGGAVKDICEWNDFVKIVAVSDDATESNGYWYDADGKEIGPSIWGEFAIIQEISSDPCNNPSLGLGNYKSKLRSGLGNW